MFHIPNRVHERLKLRSFHFFSMVLKCQNDGDECILGYNGRKVAWLSKGSARVLAEIELSVS